MTSERWPRRYRVTIVTNAGETISYPTVTFLSPEKAVAIAVAAHLRRYSEDSTGTRLRDVEIEDLGRLDRDAAGVFALNGTDLMDRMEF